MLVCPSCHESNALRPGRPTGVFDRLFRLCRWHPYRCDSCLHRFRRFGKQILETTPIERLSPHVAAPSAFTPLRFEGNKASRDNGESATAIEAGHPNIVTNLRPQPVFLKRSAFSHSTDGVATVNPLAMDPVKLEPGDLLVRLPEYEHFDPLVLRDDGAGDEVPMRAVGEHLFYPLAMKSEDSECADEIEAGRWRFSSLFARNAAARKARRPFLNSEEGWALQSAKKRQRRWILWSGVGLVALSAGVAFSLYAVAGVRGFEPKRLWLSVSVSNLLGGIVLALLYSRFMETKCGVVRHIFVDLMAGWVGESLLVHFGFAVVLVPVLSGHRLNFGFYAFAWPWLWFSYAALAAAAGIGWLVSLLQKGDVRRA